MQDALVAAEHAAVDMHDFAGKRRIRLQLVDDIRIFALRHEADVLAIRLLGDDEAHLLGKRTDFPLSATAAAQAEKII